MVAIFIFFFSSFASTTLFAQKEIITADVEKDKPVKFQNKTLRSEKTGDKKFTIPRKLMQNTVTHYNYYFNANNKLERVIDRAKASQRENFTKLLPYYPYSLNTTAAQKTELDSVIYKATAGILLHDLRNNWVDDLYFLIGQAYYYRKDFDSAAMTFQFINYNLAPKKKYEDDVALVGSNDNPGATGFFSISNKEKKGFTIQKKPARNEAILWQAKTLIATGEYPEAAGLVNTLQNDPLFPARLNKELQEVAGYLYFQQEVYDSAASHLQRSFSPNETKQDRARKQFLLAQLLELSHQPANASEFYLKAAANTTDPLLDIYANLYSAKILKGKAVNELDNNITNLLRLAKKGKFENYRDIVFYSAGELALQKPDTALANTYFKKSLAVNINNASFKNKAFLQLANLQFTNKHYKYAAMYYDSIDVNDEALVDDARQIIERKKSLTGIVRYLNAVEREDSLQTLAKMTPAAREELIKKLLKKLRKEKGLKEEQNYISPSSAFNKSNSQDVFGNVNPSGDWYFNNTSAKSRGYSEFKSKWGKRDNIDNWMIHRSSGGGLAGNKLTSNPDNVSDVSIVDNGVNPANPDIAQSSNPLIPLDLTYDGLLANIPTTDDKLKVSNTSLSSALYRLGNIYSNSLEDYDMTIQTLERSLTLFPDSLYNGQIYSQLSYAYQKQGNNAKADYYKNLVNSKFQNSPYSQSSLKSAVLPPAKQNPAATASYDKIYNSFIEGDFIIAVEEKKKADSLYGKTYWNPQLLYIEAMYHIRVREDSIAIVILNQLIASYPKSEIKPKAENLIKVVQRRKEIENYLTNLKIERENDSVINKEIAQGGIANAPLSNSSGAPQPRKEDVIRKSIPPPPVSPTSIGTVPSLFSFDPTVAQNVVMVLDKVDGVYISEAKNAFNRYNKEKFSSLNLSIVRDQLNPDKALLIFAPFANADAALTYLASLRNAAKSEISWLPAFKYSFIIMSDNNILILKKNQNLPSYLDLLKSKYPGKF